MEALDRPAAFQDSVNQYLFCGLAAIRQIILHGIEMSEDVVLEQFQERE